jgi:ArsR family transcriptional regulator
LHLEETRARVSASLIYLSIDNVIEEDAVTRGPVATRSSLPIAEIKAELFRALGHPARIRLLELLSERPRPVGELLPLIGLEASHLSQQLGVLRRAGLVTVERDGTSAIYALSDPQIAALLAVAKRILLRSLTESQGLLAQLRRPSSTP